MPSPNAGGRAARENGGDTTRGIHMTSNLFARL
eukprot:SAG22_NODE_12424_length_443_cov_1.052326_1_plen_32_part_10